jgi:hypothetical protein
MSLIKSITNITKVLNYSHCRVLLALSLFLCSIVAEAADQTNISVYISRSKYSITRNITTQFNAKSSN